jgi:lipoate-protein ligase A
VSGALAGWVVERHSGQAGPLHLLADPELPRRTVRVMDVLRPALVLGSSQPAEVVDEVRAAQAGVDIVRRRSGGGAVLVGPGDQTWVDLLVPAGDPLWDDDVVAAARWAGEAWATALDRIDLGPGRVHDGGLARTNWTAMVCFAGLGPGEVTVAGRKVVGLSQRRNRSWIRIQTTALTRWNPRELIDLLVLETPDRQRLADMLGDAAAALRADHEDLVASLLASLPR